MTAEINAAGACIKVGDHPERRSEGAPTFRRLTVFAKPRGSGEKVKANTNCIAQTQSRSQTVAPLARSSPGFNHTDAAK